MKKLKWLIPIAVIAVFVYRKKKAAAEAATPHPTQAEIEAADPEASTDSGTSEITLNYQRDFSSPSWFSNMFSFTSDTPAASTEVVTTSLTPMNTNSWTRFDSLYKKYGAKHGIDWQWLKAFALKESLNGIAKPVALGLKEPTNPKSVSYDGLSYGLMQMTLATANDPQVLSGSGYQGPITLAELNNPEISIDLAAKYIKMIVGWVRAWQPLEPYDLFVKHVVGAYNMGIGNVKKGKEYSYQPTYYKGREIAPYYDQWMNHLQAVKTRVS